MKNFSKLFITMYLCFLFFFLIDITFFTDVKFDERYPVSKNEIILLFLVYLLIEVLFCSFIITLFNKGLSYFSLGFYNFNMSLLGLSIATASKFVQIFIYKSSNVTLIILSTAAIIFVGNIVFLKIKEKVFLKE